MDDVGKGIRINKYVADCGVCSRREADQLIKEGAVLINGQRAILGDHVADKDVVTVKGKHISPKKNVVWIALNKPVGIVCSADGSDDNVIDYINYPQRIFYVGRLDRSSRGLLLLTNDGEYANRLIRSKNMHEKEYIVTVDKPVTGSFLKDMEKGVEIEKGVITRPCRTKRIDERTFNIIITQGLNRQIRRMCEAFGYRVRRLERIRIKNIKLGDLKYGDWRILSAEEIRSLYTGL